MQEQYKQVYPIEKEEADGDVLNSFASCANI